MNSVTISQAFNGHGHPRYGTLMNTVVRHVAERYEACVAMPNPKGFLITSVDRMIEYHRALDEAAEGNVRWVMKLYLTDTLTPAEIERACELPYFGGIKYYPRGLTTNSDEGIADPRTLWQRGTNAYEVLRVLAAARKPASYHGADGFDEAGEELDPYKQEEHFFWHTAPRLLETHPDLIHIFEHVTSIPGVMFMRVNGGDTVGCTITAHHPLLDRRDVYRKGFHPNLFCWPVIQSAEHRQELADFTTSGLPFVMLGDDGAGHPRDAKECGCCAGGVYTAPVALELYTQLFAEHGALEHLDGFASRNGRRFYGLPMPTGTTTLIRKDWRPPPLFTCDDGTTEVIGFEMPDRNGNGPPPLQWQIAA